MKDYSPQAFPGSSAEISGMSLRDYTAIAALKSLLTHEYIVAKLTASQICKDAYKFADEMLLAREGD